MWVEDLEQHVKNRLERGENGDFVFESLQFDENWFSCVDNPLSFAQWGYLVNPYAFENALRGTKYDPFPGFVVCQTAKLTGSHPFLRLDWEFTVQYLLSACDGDGIMVEIRWFPLVLIQDDTKKTLNAS